MRAGFRVALLALPGLVGLAGALQPLPAAAQATNFRQEMEDIRNAIPGLGVDRAPIDFTERAPLVVPPTNNLPPPTEGTRLGVNDPDEIARRTALSDPRRPVPVTDPGAAAAGADRRAYLIEPPSGMQNPAAVAAEAGRDGFKDAAPKKKKSTSWFSGGGHHHKKKTDSTASAN